jgi:hypothetical protein
LAISIFDSRQPPYSGQGVYVSAVGETVPESELDAGLEVYSGVSRQRGLPGWDRSKVTSPAKHRLYRAVAAELFVLDSRDQRQPVPLV